MKFRTEISWLSLPIFVQAATVTYKIPSAAPTSAAKLAPAPIGLSFEFFAYPSYFANVTATKQCLANFKDSSGTWSPISIGSTTQYVFIFKNWGVVEIDKRIVEIVQFLIRVQGAYVVYTVASPADAPEPLTFGTNFMKLASTYPRTVVMGMFPLDAGNTRPSACIANLQGLNRGLSDNTNTIAAAKSVKAIMGNLVINQSVYYVSDEQPIASPPWTPAIDAASQNNWDIQVGTALDSAHIIQAGNSNASPPTWGAAELIASGNATVRTFVKDYAHHNYPGGSLQSSMSHSGSVSNMAPIGMDGMAANVVGKEYVLGETNSVSGGGAATFSPTFGAAIWTLDYALQATTLNITTIYYHHGTVGNCYYCWRGRYNAGAPYYGAWFAASTFAESTYIQQIDTGTSNYGTYVLYNSSKVYVKAVLINGDFYNGTGTRGSQTLVLGGLTGGKEVKAKRLTAGNASSRVDQGSDPSFRGQVVANRTCVIGGKEIFERVIVGGEGTASFTVAASEALLVYFEGG